MISMVPLDAMTQKFFFWGFNYAGFLSIHAQKIVPKQYQVLIFIIQYKKNNPVGFRRSMIFCQFNAQESNTSVKKIKYKIEISKE